MLLGMLLAFGASLFWTFSPVFFAAAGRRIGPYRVNVTRLLMAGIMLVVIGAVYTAFAPGRQCVVAWRATLYLVLSGLLGLVVGDQFYLRALTMIGPRRTIQLITLTPILPVLVAWVALGERLSTTVMLGIAMVMGGIGFVVYREQTPTHEEKGEPGTFSYKGLLVGLAGIAFHSSGAIMARAAFVAAPEMDPIIATTVRVASSALILAFVAIVRRDLGDAVRSLREPGTLGRLTGGVITGPVIGMLLYVAAFKFAFAGVVSTLSGLSPVLILPVIALRYKTRIRTEALIGALVTVAGASLIGVGAR